MSFCEALYSLRKVYSGEEEEGEEEEEEKEEEEEEEEEEQQQEEEEEQQQEEEEDGLTSSIWEVCEWTLTVFRMLWKMYGNAENPWCFERCSLLFSLTRLFYVGFYNYVTW